MHKIEQDLNPMERLNELSCQQENGDMQTLGITSQGIFIQTLLFHTIYSKVLMVMIEAQIQTC